MPAYISLINWTDQGARTAQSTVNRSNEVDKLLQSMGGRKIAVWWTMGQYDVVFVFEAPDDETATAFLATVAKAGNLRTSTMRCFSEEETARIMSKVK